MDFTKLYTKFDKVVKVLDGYTDNVNISDYLLAPALMGLKAAVLIPKSIELLMERPSVVHTKDIPIDKHLSDTRLIKKDIDFISNSMRDSICMVGQYPADFTVEQFLEHGFGRLVKNIGVVPQMYSYEVIENKTHRDFYVETAKLPQSTILGNMMFKVFIFPNEHTTIMYADHYYLDGEFIFQCIFCNFLMFNLKLDYRKFIPYTYIPIISDAKAVSRLGELLQSYLKYPLLGKVGKATKMRSYELFSSKTPPIKSDISLRFVNYARALYPMFAISERPYFRVAITVGLDVNRFLSNNRISIIQFIIFRPNMKQSYETIIPQMAKTIETKIDEHKLDAFLSYDAATSLDKTIASKMGLNSRSMNDIVFSPFHFTSSDTNIEKANAYVTGGFGGGFNQSFTFIASTSIGTNFQVCSYTTNNDDIRIDELQSLHRPISDMYEIPH